MLYTVLQKNLEKIIKDRNYQIADLERKSGLKKNNIYNILKGISKKPSAEIVQRIANVLGITTEDLYNPLVDVSNPYLTKRDFEIFREVWESVIEEVILSNSKLTQNDLLSMIFEVFKYSSQDSDSHKENVKALIDRKFIKWKLRDFANR